MNHHEYRCDNCNTVDRVAWSEPSKPIENKRLKRVSFNSYGFCKNNHAIVFRITVRNIEKYRAADNE